MIVTIDFETYYDQDYTLKKMSTSEYIRDPRFKVLNVAVKMGNAKPYVVWGHEQAGKALRAIDWAKHELLAHHAHFEGLILSHHYGVVPRAYRDTLSMARAVFPKTDRNDLGSLTERLGVANKLEMPDFKGKTEQDLAPAERAAIEAYVTGDVESCAQAYEKLVARVPHEEMELIDVTVRMFAEPVLRLDTARVKTELARERKAKADAIANAGIALEELTSANKFAAALQKLGVVPPQKISKTTGKLTWAFAQTDNDFTSLVNHPDPMVSALVEARLAAKSTIGETRAMRLLKAGSARRRIPVYLNYCGAHTTRWSGGDKLNFQNFPRGGELRKSLLAPPGHVIVVVDSSQIEARVLAWLAGEQWLLDEFARPDGDPYSAFATKVYGRVITKADREERQVGKVCVLGLGYGMGAFKLQLMLSWGTMGPKMDVALEVCEGWVRIYRSSNRAITGFWDVMGDAIGDMAKGRDGDHKCISWEKDSLHLPNGLTLHYPHTTAIVEKRGSRMFGGGGGREVVMDGSYQTPRGRSKLYGGLFTENVVQAIARVIVAEFMRVIARRYRVVMMSHDEVVYLAPKAQAQKALDFGLEVFRTRPTWAPELPLNAEGGYDACYSK